MSDFILKMKRRVGISLVSRYFTFESRFYLCRNRRCSNSAKMEHISFEAKSKKLQLKKSAIPKPGKNDVLIKVAYSGVCGTDLHIIEGAFPCKANGPVTLGHEFAGCVQAIGENVTNFKIGDRVAVDPNDACGLCDDCHKGNYHLCMKRGLNNTVGIFRDGGWSTHCIVPEKQIFRVPDCVELPQAALTEPLSCLAHGWDLATPIVVGQKVLVMGAGIIGCLWASALHLHGLRKTVTIIETQETRLKNAHKLDLDYEVKSPEDLEECFDLAVDCSGSGEAIENAIQLLNRGGRLCIFGVANPKTKVSFEPFTMYKKEQTFFGALVNPFTFPKGIGLLEAMADTYLQYDRLGIKIFKLCEYEDALEELKAGSINKAVFEL